MKYKKRSKIRKPIKLLLVFLAVLSLGCLFSLLEITGVTDFYKREKPVQETVTQPVNTINYDPPTKPEQSSGNDQKDKIVSQDSVQQPKQEEVEIVIVDASQYENEIEVRAFASNILENGTCIFSFSLAGQATITKETAAYADASTTPCITLTVPRADFAMPGDWQLTVSFSSANYKGNASQKVVIK